MRKLIVWLVLVVVVALLALPAVAMATETGSPPGESVFGLDLVTFAVLGGVVVAVSDYLMDMLKVAGKSRKLLVVLIVGFGLTTFAHFYGLEHWVIRSLIVPVSAAGYYKLLKRDSNSVTNHVYRE